MKQTLSILAILILVVASFYLCENTRGKVAWSQTQTYLKSKGESLDPATYSPPPVPDDQNFWGTPLLLDFVPKDEAARNEPGREARTDRLKEIDINNADPAEMDEGKDGTPLKPPVWANMNRNTRYNLADWAAYYAANKKYKPILRGKSDAERILSAFQPFDGELKELTLASDRPFSQIPKKHDPAGVLTEPLDFISISIGLSKALSLRAYAAAAAHDERTFRDSIRIMIRMNEGLYRDPLVISQLVAVLSQNMFLQTIWQCLEERLLSSQELAWLETELGPIKVLPTARNAVAFEAILSTPASYDITITTDASGRPIYRNITDVLDNFSFNNPQAALQQTIFILTPSGWFDQQKKNMVLSLYTEVVIPFRAEPIGPHIAALTKADDLLRTEALKGVWFDPLAGERFSMGTYTIISFLQGETTLRQARIACALERYYLDHHAYPRDLQPLVPAYLKEIPKDLIDGAPMRYRTTPQGRYVVYSIGWNQTDDGGLMPDYEKYKGLIARAAVDDWVWSYPPAVPAAKD